MSVLNYCAATDSLQENLWLLTASVVSSFYDGVQYYCGVWQRVAL